MTTREIPEAEWRRFLDGFTDAHEGWLVRLDLIGAPIGAQHQIVNLPLIGVTTDAPAFPTVHVHAGRPPGALTHSIRRVTRLQLEQTEDGVDQALQIESDDGMKALLQFRSPVRTDTVDGVAATVPFGVH